MSHTGYDFTVNNIPGDVILDLPTDDKIIPTNNEIQIVDNLFKQNEKGLFRIMQHSRDVIIVGLLYLIFCLPQIDSLICKFIPKASESIYFLILIKTLIFMFLYFILKNWYLARKK